MCPDLAEPNNRLARVYLLERPLCLTAYIFKMPEPTRVIFGTLQRRSILNSLIVFIVILNKSLTQSGTTQR